MNPKSVILVISVLMNIGLLAFVATSAMISPVSEIRHRRPEIRNFDYNRLIESSLLTTEGREVVRETIKDKLPVLREKRRAMRELTRRYRESIYSQPFDPEVLKDLNTQLAQARQEQQILSYTIFIDAIAALPEDKRVEILEERRKRAKKREERRQARREQRRKKKNGEQ